MVEASCSSWLTILAFAQVISNVLKDKRVKFSAPQELVFARNDGLPLLDIRPNTQFKQG